MPVSSSENKQSIIEWVKQINPRSVLDVGAGEGTYSTLLRGHTEAEWVAVEAWGPYVSQFELEGKYDRVIVADIRYLNPILLANDLIILGDMLEHMAKHQAIAVISDAQKKAKNIIISVPLVHLGQEPYEGNWFEVHQDHWDFQEMKEFLGKGLRDSIEGEILGYFWWQVKKSA